MESETNALRIHGLFESQTRRTPQKVAVVYEGQHLTYDKLNCRANQLARHLRGLGVKPEVKVGICMERSLEMVVGILAVLKAGGAYVPLDSRYPTERLHFMFQDAQVTVLLTQSSFLEMFPSQDVLSVCVDKEQETLSRLCADNLPHEVSSKNLAYIIYTSGSTGIPKGVMVTHENLCRFVNVVPQVLGVTSEDVYLVTGSITYALSVRQFMVPLCHGATLVIPTTAQLMDPSALFRVIKRRKVTRTDFVPSQWRAYLQALAEIDDGARAELLDNALQQIVTVGEPLIPDTPIQWRSEFGHNANLVNIFGQTESTGLVSAYPLLDMPSECLRTVSIGKAVPSTQLYILDPTMQPVSPGDVGELCISSPCLARGYLNRPELTAQKFIPNPFSSDPGARLYRTGDLVRNLPDGNIEYLGRADNQIKIRGMRVEPGEIEARLRQHPAVKDAVVMLQKTRSKNLSLTGYIVGGASLSASVLQAFLRATLPAHMIPSEYVFLESLPFTPNGKLDRRRLPVPDDAESLSDGPAGMLPENEIEQQIYELIRTILCKEGISVTTPFLDLGLTSLMMVQVRNKLKSTFQENIPVSELFRYPTIRALANHLRQKQGRSHLLHPARKRAETRKAFRSQRAQSHTRQHTTYEGDV